MTLARLKEVCLKNGLYRTPSVNDKLYLHYEGFSEIDGAVLGEYTGLKCLWLQGNGLTKIQGLEKLVLVRSLSLHENCIDTLEGLEMLTALQSLNLANNFIKDVAGLETLVALETLTLGNNSIGPGVEAMAHVRLLPKLQTLDLQANRLDDGDAVLAVLAKIADLRVLYLQGNPLVKAMRHYRKRVISTCRELRYLDDRPVFDDERRRCDVWAAALAAADGDVDAANAAERAEIVAIRDEKQAYELKRIQDFDDMIKKAKAEAAAERENRPPAPPGANFSREAIVDGNSPKRDAGVADVSPTDFVDADELD